MRLSHVFVTHTHMDHFCGFDQLLRVLLGRKDRIVLYGGPEFVAQVEHKLLAYTWNVVQRYEIEFVIEARELGLDGRIQCARFSSRNQFRREVSAPFELIDDVLHEEVTFRVRGRFVDHHIPCLAYAIEQTAQVKIGKDRIAALGVATGSWLRELKHAVLTGAPPDTPIHLEWRDRHGKHALTRQVGELRELVLEVTPGRRIGYVTDLRYTEANLRVLSDLIAGVDLLYIESVFLQDDEAHAVRKNHLTAYQAGRIARCVGAKAIVPFHFSPRYKECPAALIAEAQAAWSDRPAEAHRPPPMSG
jgi:ribonuclease Z